MKISIFGTGYVGLVTGTCFAELGNEVICCDTDEGKITNLERGIIPIFEPGLEEMVLRNHKEKRLLFTTDLKEAVEFGEIIFIAVGTPPKDYGKADLRYIHSVAETIGKYIKEDNKIIVTKSTVPVGTNKEVFSIINEGLKKRNADYHFAIASNPEFLKEGDAISDFMQPDRVVIGTEIPWAEAKRRSLYSSVIKNDNHIFFMDIASAEMAKYAANAMLATKISFINQISNLCDMVGADVEEVRKALSSDSRIGNQFLNPGPGYGGSCFPKDVQALSVLAKEFGYTPQLIEAVEAVNEAQKEILAKKIITKINDVNGKNISVWGLSFKPNTDDMRCAPSINIIEKLIAKGAQITAFDPIAINEAKKVFGDRIKYSDDMYNCLRGAEALVIITEWSQFKEPDFNKIKSLLTTPLIIDGRNLYEPEKMKELEIEYMCIGRPEVVANKQFIQV